MASTIRISILADAARAVRGLGETGAAATGVNRRLAELHRQVKALDGSNAKINIDAKGLNETANKLTLIAAGVLSATAAVGPLTGALVGIGAAFSAATAGVALFGAVAAPTIKDVTEGLEKYKTAEDAVEKAQATGNKKAVIKAQKDMAAALSTLTPLQRESAKQIIAMQKSWDKLSASQAPTVLRIISQAAGSLNRIIPKLSPAIDAMGKALGGVSGKAFVGLEKAATPLAKFITQQGVPAFKLLAQIVGNLLPTVGHLVQAFAPLGNRILAMLVPLTESLKKIDFTSFAKSAQDLLPVVSRLLGNLTGAVGNLLKGVAPLARPVLQGLSDIGAILKNALSGADFKGFVSNIAKIIPAVAPLVGVVVPMFLKFADILSGQVLALIPHVLPLVKQLADVFVNVLNGLSPLLGPLLNLVGILVSLIPVVFPVITALRDALLPVFDALGDALIQLKPSFRDAVTAFTSLFEPISNILAAVLQMAPTLLKSLVPAFVILVGVVNNVLVGLRPLFPVLGQIITNLAEGLTPVIRAVADAVPGIAAALGKLAIPLAGFITGLQPLFPVMAQLVTAVTDGMMPILQALADAMPGVVAAVVPLVPVLVDILKALIPLIPPISELAVLLIQLLVPILVRSIAPIVQLAGLFARVLPAAVGVVVGAIRGVTSIIRDLVNMLGSIPGIGADIVNGLLNGLVSGWHKVTDFLSRATRAIPDGIRRLLGISSPSKVMAGLGANIGQGLVEGIASTVPDLRSQLGDVSSLIQTGVTAKANVSLSTTGQLPVALSSAVQPAAPVNVYITVQPGADAAEVGRQAVNAIEAYERQTGRRRLVPAL